jgi:hypothetical protein
MRADVDVDGYPKSLHAVEDTASDGLVGDLAEPSLDEIESRA